MPKIVFVIACPEFRDFAKRMAKFFCEKELSDLRHQFTSTYVSPSTSAKVLACKINNNSYQIQLYFWMGIPDFSQKDLDLAIQCPRVVSFFFTPSATDDIFLHSLLNLREEQKKGNSYMTFQVINKYKTDFKEKREKIWDNHIVTAKAHAEVPTEYYQDNIFCKISDFVASFLYAPILPPMPPSPETWEREHPKAVNRTARMSVGPKLPFPRPQDAEERPVPVQRSCHRPRGTK